MGDISIRGKSPILRQSFAVGGAVRRLGKGLRVRKGRGKDFKTHGKDVPTMAAEGGRIGLKHGGKPWGTGPKPGTIEFLQQHLHKPRKGKAIGGVAKIGKILAKKFKKKKVYPETEDLTHQVGPYAGDVGSEGKRRGAGPRAKGKSPGIPQAPGPRGRRPWRRAIPGRPRPGTPAPKYKPPIGKFPPPERKYKRPIDKWPPPERKYQPAAEGGRIGFKKGTDKKWMQKVSASIKKRGTKGKCTPITKPGCTGRAKALAKTFKKIAAKRKKS